MHSFVRSAAARIALYLFAGTAIILGCRGAVERNYFDDDAEAGDADVADGPTNLGDAPIDARDGGSDAPSDAPADADATDAGPPRTIGGVVLGLDGTGMVLRLNGANDLAVSPSGGANVGFTFLKTLTAGAAFTVTINTQPGGPAQTCSVSGGSGVVGGGNVTTVIVNCLKDKFTVGGNISGLEGTITLANNGGDSVTLNANGSFAFPTPLDSLASYAVTIQSHSALPAQTCTLTKGSGAVANVNVTDISVSCTTKAYTVGGNVTGVAGVTLVVSNGAETLPLTVDGPFTFAQTVLSNRPYDVKVFTLPPNKTCTITNGAGTVTTANITNVGVQCVTQFALVENFDAVVVPGLPSGWTSVRLDTGGGNPSLFRTVNTASGQLPAASSPANSCNVLEGSLASDIALTSPTFTVESSNAILTFSHAYALEASFPNAAIGYDGVVLEVSANGGPFVDVGAAAFTTGGYVTTLSALYDNPLGGRAAWSGWTTPSTWVTTSVKLPLTVGQSGRIRFRQGTDKQNVSCDAPANRACLGFRLDTLTVAN